MKEILKTSREIANNLNAIEQFMFVLSELRPDDLTKEIQDKILERIDNAAVECNRISDVCDKILSNSSIKHHKRFDIMKPNGAIELGLLADSEEKLRETFLMSGEKDIQILREINEYGMIVKENPPHYPNSMFSNSSFRSESIDHTGSNPVLSANDNTENILESEYEKFQNDPAGYKGPLARKWDEDNAKAEAEAVKSLKKVREKDTKPSDTVSEMEFLKRMENDAKETKEFLDKMMENVTKNADIAKKPKKISKKSKKASKK